MFYTVENSIGGWYRFVDDIHTEQCIKSECRSVVAQFTLRWYDMLRLQWIYEYSCKFKSEITFLLSQYLLYSLSLMVACSYSQNKQEFSRKIRMYEYSFNTLTNVRRGKRMDSTKHSIINILYSIINYIIVLVDVIWYSDIRILYL